MLHFIKKPFFSRCFIALIFVTAGVLHFIKTQAYIEVMPAYIPWHRAMVLISGVAEILGGVGVIVPQTIKWAGWGLIILLIAVFPVNIDMAVEAFQYQPWSLKAIAYLVRLPLQFVLIYWIYRSCVKKYQ